MTYRTNESYLLQETQTKRLCFRKFEKSDFQDWLPFYHDPRSTQYWEGLPKDPIKACEEQFERLFERYEKNLGGMNALVLRTTGKLIGMAGLLIQTVDTVQELEIGYSILPKCRKNGYATEAAVQCKNHAFKNKLADSLISIIHVDNVPSQKVAIRNGMYLEKTTTYKKNPVHIFRISS